MTELEILAKNVKRYRNVRGLKQSELAEKIGISSDYMCKIENAKTDNIGSKYLFRICRELKIELVQLFMEDPEELFLKFVMSSQNLSSFERLLNLIIDRFDFSLKQDPDEPIFYHRKNCACVKCREKRGEK